MKTKIFSLLVFILLFWTISFSQNTIVKGKLQSADGKPLHNAKISYSTPYDKITKHSVDVEKDGSYSVTLSSFGVTHLTFAGANHKSSSIPIINNKDQTIELDVYLNGYKYVDSFDDVKIIGEFNNFDFNTARSMTKQDDGTYSFSMNWDKPLFKYQLLNVEDSKRSINGTQSEDYEYDGGGDYRSVVSTQNGTVQIVFNPKKLPNIKEAKITEFKSANNTSSVLFKYNKLNNDYFDVFFKQFKEYQDAGKDPKAFKFDGRDLEKNFKNVIHSEKNDTARQIGMSFYICLPRTSKIDIDSLEIVKLFDSFDVNSFLWQANPNLINRTYLSLGNDKGVKFIDNLFNTTKNKSVKFRLLQQKYFTARSKNDVDELRKLYKVTQDEFGDTEIGNSFLKQFSMVIKIVEGADIPDFNVKSFDDSTKVISKSNMLGKIYLIDFWATWCGPCVGEMPNLHEVYEKYKDKGLEILSFSLDNGTKEIYEFREKRYKMPWLNVYLGPDWNQPLVKSFEVDGIPKPILVGKDGKILAIERDLRGDKLDKTLSKMFK